VDNSLRMTRPIAAAALALGLLAAPASAADVEKLDKCYASAGQARDQREDVGVSGTSFTPDASVEVLLDGVLVAAPRTDAIGDFTAFVDAPYQPRGERAFTITVRDPANPAWTFDLPSRVTNLAVRMRPRRAAPSHRVRFRGRGFTLPRRPVFAHYLFDGEEKTTVRLARRTHGACGRFTARKRQIPIDEPRSGRWIVQFDQKRDYSPVPDPVWVRVPIDVTRVFLEP
jgi:hypothetical protein